MATEASGGEAPSAPATLLPGDGASAPLVPASPTGCFDASELERCEDSVVPPPEPVSLVEASRFGEGFEFTHVEGYGALARSGDDYEFVLFRGGPDDAGENRPLEWPGERDFELRGLTQHQGRWFVLGCTNACCTLLTLDVNLPGPWQLTPFGPSQALAEWSLGQWDRDGSALEPAALRAAGIDAAVGIESLEDALCIYGAGAQCLRYGQWSVAAEPGVSVIDMQWWLLLRSDGQVYSASGSPYGEPLVWTRVDQSASFNQLGEGVALGRGNAFLYFDGSSWLECTQSQPLVTAGGLERLDERGTLTVGSLRYPREPCRSSVVFDPGAVVASAPYLCGLSSNWLLMTKTNIWAVYGKLGCALG